MFNAWDAHYRQVNVLRFTVDGQALVSGSEDSGVGVWSMSSYVLISHTLSSESNKLLSLLDNASQNDLVSPYTLLSDHTLRSEHDKRWRSRPDDWIYPFSYCGATIVTWTKSLPKVNIIAGS